MGIDGKEIQGVAAPIVVIIAIQQIGGQIIVKIKGDTAGRAGIGAVINLIRIVIAIVILVEAGIVNTGTGGDGAVIIVWLKDIDRAAIVGNRPNRAWENLIITLCGHIKGVGAKAIEQDLFGRGQRSTSGI